MKILVVSDLYPPVAFGGYELDCESFVEGLRPRHEVTVLTSNLYRESTAPDPVVRRELPWVGTDRRVRETARAPVAAARGARVMRRMLAELRPDLVFAFNCVGISQAVPLAALQLGVPLAFRLSETFFATELLWGDRFLRHLRRGDRGLRAAWGLVVRAANRADPALRIRPAAPSRVAVSWASANLRLRTTLPDGMEIALERVVYPISRQSEGLADLDRRPFERPTILYVGRVTVGKGIEVAYRALAALRERHGVDAELLVLGHAAPPTRKSLGRLAAELGIDEHIQLWGQADPERLVEALRASHAIVVPSLVPDVFPLVLIEAAMARLPIVASRVGGIPEAVIAGEHALLVEPGDVASCAAALARTLADPEAAQARAARAFAHMNTLTMKRYIEESEAFVTDALAVLRRNGR